MALNLIFVYTSPLLYQTWLFCCSCISHSYGDVNLCNPANSSHRICGREYLMNLYIETEMAVLFDFVRFLPQNRVEKSIKIVVVKYCCCVYLFALGGLGTFWCYLKVWNTPFRAMLKKLLVSLSYMEYESK